LTKNLINIEFNFSKQVSIRAKPVVKKTRSVTTKYLNVRDFSSPERNDSVVELLFKTSIAANGAKKVKILSEIRTPEPYLKEQPL
jgi:hypothetical protein